MARSLTLQQHIDLQQAIDLLLADPTSRNDFVTESTARLGGDESGWMIVVGDLVGSYQFENVLVFQVIDVVSRGPGLLD